MAVASPAPAANTRQGSGVHRTPSSAHLSSRLGGTAEDVRAVVRTAVAVAGRKASAPCRLNSTEPLDARCFVGKRRLSLARII